MKGDQKLLECFMVDRSTPCLRGVGVKVLSGKEGTTLLSMAVCRVKQVNISTAHQIWNKTPDSRASKGERTHRGSKDPSTQKKKVHALNHKKLTQARTATSFTGHYHFLTGSHVLALTFSNRAPNILKWQSLLNKIYASIRVAYSSKNMVISGFNPNFT